MRQLESEAYLKVVGEASDGAEAFKLALELKPDILLLDSAMPGSQAWKCMVTATRPRVDLNIESVGSGAEVFGVQTYTGFTSTFDAKKQ